jgi:uncharacterized cupredoxin-like copper-binding protein
MRRIVRIAALVALVGVPSLLVHANVAGAAATKRTIKVAARSYAFKPAKLALAKGEAVTIELHSTDTTHDFVVSGPGVGAKKIADASGGATARGTLKLTKTGKYDFFCSIPGHRAAGMRGTITVS